MKRLFLTLCAATLLLNQASSHAAGYRIKPSQLKKYQGHLVKCPQYVINLKAGLATSLLARDTLCLSSNNLGKLSKRIRKIDFPLDGRAKLGSVFPDVEEQQGDVQTAPFIIGHYAALTSYSISQFSGSESFTASIRDTITGKALSSYFRTKGSEESVDAPLDGEIAWFSRGSYYLRIETKNRDLQPLYSFTPSFMEPYEGYPVSVSELSQAGVKTSYCPRYLLDTRTGNLAAIGKGYVCSTSNREKIEDAGLTLAPYSLAIGMFLPLSIDCSFTGSNRSLPFRVNGPVELGYTVTDNSESLRGHTKLYLYEIGTGRRTPLADIKGTIDGPTTTYINIPGEYVVEGVTSPSEVKKYGDIDWSITVEGT